MQNSSKMMIYLALISVFAFPCILCSPGGAPSSACDSMTPGHGVSAQSSAFPYTIIPSSQTYRCGETITVTLSGGNFRGFLCQARTNVADYASTVGTLAQAGSVVMKMNCGSGRALTHSENGDKSTAQFTWEPSADHGSVYIVCSVVQTKLTFWVKETSAALTYGGGCDVTGSPSGNPTGSTMSSSTNNNAGGPTTPNAVGKVRVSAVIVLLMTVVSSLL